MWEKSSKISFFLLTRRSVGGFWGRCRIFWKKKDWEALIEFEGIILARKIFWIVCGIFLEKIGLIFCCWRISRKNYQSFWGYRKILISVFKGVFIFWTFGPTKFLKSGQMNFQGKLYWTNHFEFFAFWSKAFSSSDLIQNRFE